MIRHPVQPNIEATVGTSDGGYMAAVPRRCCHHLSEVPTVLLLTIPLVTYSSQKWFFSTYILWSFDPSRWSLNAGESALSEALEDDHDQAP